MKASKRQQMVNTDFAEGIDKAIFLQWLAVESFNPCGADKKELNAIIEKWLKKLDSDNRAFNQKLIDARNEEAQ